MANKDIKILVNSEYLFEKNMMQIGLGNTVVTMDDINTIRKILFKEEIKNINNYFLKVRQALNCNEYEIKKILSQKNKNLYFNYLKNLILETKDYINDYSSHHKTKISLFDKIEIIPGYEKPLYDDFTRTGRMRVTDGTSFITMKKQDRKKINIAGKAVFEIDFKSCEPSFYLFSNKVINPCLDVYSELLSLIEQKISREKFKVGFLSLMYGGGDDMVRKISGLSSSSIKVIKEKIMIESFKEKLESSVDKNNVFLNHYGRPLIANNNIINYFIQSSASDFYCLAFNNFLEKRKDITLHACIHDAILCSIDKSKINSLKDITYLSDGVTNLKLPVNIEVY